MRYGLFSFSVILLLTSANFTLSASSESVSQTKQLDGIQQHLTFKNQGFNDQDILLTNKPFTIIENIILEGGAQIILTSCDNSIIRNVTIRSGENKEPAITVLGSTNVTISNTSLFNNNETGIYIDASNHIKIYSNFFFEQQEGIGLRSSTYVLIENNTFLSQERSGDNRGTGIFFSANNVDAPDIAIEHLLIRNNEFLSLGHGIFGVGGGDFDSIIYNSNITIENNIFKSLNRGIAADGNANLIIRRNQFIPLENDDSDSSSAIDAEFLINFTVSENLIVARLLAVVLHDIQGFIFSKNEIYDTRGSYKSSFILADCENYYIAENTIESAGTAISLSTSGPLSDFSNTQGIIENNHIKDAELGISVSGHESVRIHGNIIENVSEGGIAVSSGKNITIENNEVRNSLDYGIGVDAGNEDMWVRHNRFFSVNSPILVVEDPQGIFVYENNTVDGVLVTELISYSDFSFANSPLFSIILFMLPLFELGRRRFLRRK